MQSNIHIASSQFFFLLDSPGLRPAQCIHASLRPLAQLAVRLRQALTPRLQCTALPLAPEGRLLRGLQAVDHHANLAGIIVLREFDKAGCAMNEVQSERGVEEGARRAAFTSSRP